MACFNFHIYFTWIIAVVIFFASVSLSDDWTTAFAFWFVGVFLFFVFFVVVVIVIGGGTFLDKRDEFCWFCFRVVTLEVFEWSMLSFTSAMALVSLRLYVRWFHWCEKKGRGPRELPLAKTHSHSMSVGSLFSWGSTFKPFVSKLYLFIACQRWTQKSLFHFIRVVLLSFCEGKHFM